MLSINSWGSSLGSDRVNDVMFKLRKLHMRVPTTLSKPVVPASRPSCQCPLQATIQAIT